jgi:ribosomal protein L32
MTSIEWLIEQLEERGHIIPDHLEETAIKMHKAETIDAFKKGQALGFDDNPNYMAEQYYNQTFVSNSEIPNVCSSQTEICISCDEQKETHKICMDCIGKMIKENQKEISDEEIKKGGENAWSDYEYQEGNLYSTTFRDGWLMAIKWYKEQVSLQVDQKNKK